MVEVADKNDSQSIFEGWRNGNCPPNIHPLRDNQQNNASERVVLAHLEQY